LRQKSIWYRQVTGHSEISTLSDKVQHVSKHHNHTNLWSRFGTTQWERLCAFAYKSVCFRDVFRNWSNCIFDCD